MGLRNEQKEYRRLQILQIALELFIKKGFFGASTREISKIAGISSGLMFHYFASKEALYEALIERACTIMVLEYTEDCSPIHVFEQKLNQALQLLSEYPEAAKTFLFMSTAPYNAANISAKAAEMLAQHDIIRQSIPIIKKGQALGEIRMGNPHALSIAFWCAIQGIAEQIAFDSDNPIPDADWIIDIMKNKNYKETST